jgi:hypothetical protein
LLNEQREVCGVFVAADLDWAEYAARIKAMTKKPLQGMSLLQVKKTAEATAAGGGEVQQCGHLSFSNRQLAVAA